MRGHVTALYNVVGFFLRSTVLMNASCKVVKFVFEKAMSYTVCGW